MKKFPRLEIVIIIELLNFLREHMELPPDYLANLHSTNTADAFDQTIQLAIDQKMHSDFYEGLCDWIIQERINRELLGDMDFQFGQFYSASIALNIFMRQKNFHKMYDLIVKSFADHVVIAKENHVSFDKLFYLRCRGLINDDHLIIYLNSLCYYDQYYPRVFAAFQDDIYFRYEDLLCKPFFQGDMFYLEETLTYLCWKNSVERVDDQGKLERLVIELFNAKILACEDQVQIGIALGTRLGEKLKIDVSGLSIKLYLEFEDHFQGHQTLQVLGSAVNLDYGRLLKYKIDVFKALKIYKASIAKSGIDDLARFYESSRIFASIYIYFILAALRGGDEELANDLFARWSWEIKLKKGSNNYLLIVPNRPDGIFVGKAFIEDSSHVDKLSRLIDVQNRCLQTQEHNNVLGVPYVSKADRLGVPRVELGAEYLDCLLQVYKFDKWEGLERYRGYTVFAFPNHPLQSILVKLRMGLIPLIASIGEPRRDRELNKVGYWYTNATMTGEIERKALFDVFLKNSVEFVPICGDEVANPIDRFINFYQRKDLDVVWIAAHGEIDKFDPTKSVVSLAESVSFDIRTLPTLSGCSSRRLLVLNLCNSCTNFSMEGLGGLGIGSALTSEYQCVIGHLWPVTPMYSLFMSVVFAKSLAKHRKDFAMGFEEALAKLIVGRNAVQAELEDMDEVRVRFENGQEDFDSIINWGSAVFMA